MAQPTLSLDDLVAALRQFQQAAPVLPPAQASADAKLSRVEAKMPTFVGYTDEKTPSEFIEELENYQAAIRIADAEMVERALPLALKGEAANWLAFVGAFGTLQEFKTAFLREFNAVNYRERLEIELKNRTQAPDEPLTSYIYTIAKFFRRLKPLATEEEKIQCVLNQCHPQYKLHLRGTTFGSLADLAVAAKFIQADLLPVRDYVPPPDPSMALEPSLAWQSAKPNQHYARKEANAVASQGNRSAEHPWGLSLASVDPFSFYRMQAGSPKSEKRQVHFEQETHIPPSSNKSYRGKNKSQSRGGCYICSSKSHYCRDCPEKWSKNGDSRQ